MRPTSAGSRSPLPASRNPAFRPPRVQGAGHVRDACARRIRANFKFAPDEQALNARFAQTLRPLDNAWGRQGWTRATLAALSEAELSAALEMAWRHGAAKAKELVERR